MPHISNSVNEKRKIFTNDIYSVVFFFIYKKNEEEEGKILYH